MLNLRLYLVADGLEFCFWKGRGRHFDGLDLEGCVVVKDEDWYLSVESSGVTILKKVPNLNGSTVYCNRGILNYVGRYVILQ